MSDAAVRSPGWTGAQYSAFRIVFGVYLAAHFASLAPWARELFSAQGMLPHAALSPLYPLFPSFLFAWDAPVVALGLVCAGALLSLCLAAGFCDRIAAIGIWFVWASLFARNPFIGNPSLPFVGWLLLAHASVPPAPAGSIAARARPDLAAAWRMPEPLHRVAWIVMAVGYSYSGFTKLASPSWRDGSALAYVLANPLARPTALRDLLLGLPEPLLAGATWAALALELLFAPLALWARARPWLWLAMVVMHAGLLILIDFADLSAGMLMMHLFTFDPAWLRRRDRVRVGRRGALAAAAFALVAALHVPAEASADSAESELAAVLPVFRERVGAALAARDETIGFAAELRARHEEGKPLTGRQLERLRAGTAQHLALREDILKLIRPYESWIDAEASRNLSEAVRTKGAMMSLAGALVLYDNFASSVLLFQEQRRLRRVVNRPDPAFDLRSDELLRSLELYVDPGNRALARRGLAFVAARSAWIASAAREDPEIAWLDRAIRGSASARALSERFPTEQSVVLVKLLSASGEDLAQRVLEESTQRALRVLFGAGGEATAPVGRLGGDRAVRDDLASQLQPLDLLLDKSRYRAVDRVIPGYFTHVGIYLGSAEQLKSRGLWDHPLVKAHRAEIASGATILEAVRSGVRLTTLEKFLYLDDVALLRPTGMGADETRESLLRGFRQIGKPYDFNFDVESTERLVCSELVYLVYPDIAWPTSTLLGRAIVSPDHVARMAVGGGPLELLLFYHDGRRLEDDASEVLARLAN